MITKTPTTTSRISRVVPPFLRVINLRKTIPYEVATEIQDFLVAKQLAFKAASPPPSERPPEPHIFTFGSSPVYTFGRRERIASLPRSTIDSLIAPMPGIPGRKSKASEAHRARLFETKRGGQTTYHGPGQIMIWPIIDIKSPWPGCGPLDVRSYVNLLEECTIMTLNDVGCKSIRTQHPGVWDVTGESKIASLGVNLRRNISSYGVACNINTDLRFFDRIVACGLKGKKTTSVRKLTDKAMHPADFGLIWAENMAKLLYGPTPDNLEHSKLSKRTLIGTIQMIGLRPELTRRLWYLDAPKKLIKWAQTRKKITLPYQNSTSNDQISEDLDVVNASSPSSSSNDVFDPTQTSTEDSSNTTPRIENLLAILDQKEETVEQASFRKCAGISYWTPPIGRLSPSSVVRKVGVTSYRGQEKK